MTQSAQTASKYRTKTIRDTLHGRMHITPIEQLFIDLPEFQRLRHITQQSLAYSTFPSNTTSRFSHSLGAMHICGRMFKSAIEHSSQATLEAFIKDARLAIGHVLQNICSRGTSAYRGKQAPKIDVVLRQFREIIGSPLGLNHRPFGAAPHQYVAINEDDRTVLNVCWQAARLATLLHDVGHLPLSHLFEDALRSYSTSKKTKPRNIASIANNFVDNYTTEVAECLDVNARAIADWHFWHSPHYHEILGFYVDRNVMSSKQRQRWACAVCFHMAQLVLASPSSQFWAVTKEVVKAQHRIYAFLHSLISGEIDADRLDYAMRDPLAAGLPSSGIDLDRLTGDVELVSVGKALLASKEVRADATSTESVNESDDERVAPSFAGYVSGAEPAVGEDHGENRMYILAFRTKAIPAIELFFFSRMHSFREIAGDHHSARMFAIGEEILRRLFRIIDLATTQFENASSASTALERISGQLRLDGWYSTSAVDEASDGGEVNKQHGDSACDSDQSMRQVGPKEVVQLPFLLPGSLVRYDDSWLRTSLTNIFRVLHDLIPDNQSEGVDDPASGKDLSKVDPEVGELFLLLDVFLNRNIQHVASVIKSPADAGSLARGIASDLVSGDILPEWGVGQDGLEVFAEKLPREMQRKVAAVAGMTVASGANSPDIENVLVESVCNNAEASRRRAMILVHSTPVKFAPYRKRGLPSNVWMVNRDHLSNEVLISDAVLWSSVFDAFTRTRLPSTLRITIVGDAIRSDLGEYDPNGFLSESLFTIRSSLSRYACGSVIVGVLKHLRSEAEDLDSYTLSVGSLRNKGMLLEDWQQRVVAATSHSLGRFRHASQWAAFHLLPPKPVRLPIVIRAHLEAKSSGPQPAKPLRLPADPACAVIVELKELREAQGNGHKS